MLFAVINIILSGCDSDGLSSNSGLTADYILTFESTWSSETFPINFPQNPHFSGLIGANHNGNVNFWEVGQPASVGIKDVAERGIKDAFISELEQAVRDKNAGEVLSGGGIGTSPGSVSISFQVSKNFPLVTVISMLAPSPDWFAGTSALNLYENGNWAEEKIVELFVYDAGTDDGNDYVSPDQVTSPLQNIQKIEEPPFKIDGALHSVGTFTFTLKK